MVHGEVEKLVVAGILRIQDALPGGVQDFAVHEPDVVGSGRGVRVVGDLQGVVADVHGVENEAVDHDVRLAVDERSEEHTSELQSQSNLVCRLLLEKKK